MCMVCSSLVCTAFNRSSFPSAHTLLGIWHNHDSPSLPYDASRHSLPLARVRVALALLAFVALDTFALVALALDALALDPFAFALARGRAASSSSSSNPSPVVAAPLPDGAALSVGPDKDLAPTQLLAAQR